MPPLLLLVGADKGGTGKTFVCRALIDDLAARGVPLRVFDTEPHPGVLARFHKPAALVALEQVPGQMRVFDGLADNAVTLVDIRAGLLSPTLRALRDVGLLADARERRLRIAVLHVLGASVASLREVPAVASFLAGGVGAHILVKNYASADTHLFEWDQGANASLFPAAASSALITVPHLDGMAAETVEKEGVSFLSFADGAADAAGAPRSRTLRGTVRHWLGQVRVEFERVGLAALAATRVAPPNT